MIIAFRLVILLRGITARVFLVILIVIATSAIVVGAEVVIV